ncbi:unnamed protein product [Cyprideis torosa]|uniref:Uncharacterized protein n=1 Tax=Cyprideis torosa TaxID=163714 RepID=A0A7R8ZL07_9CRUS|nr:unnamed protein product [Cyprideis torosa]CAG0890686.1 unnamed protein product [Cyprideis torosa]
MFQFVLADNLTGFHFEFGEGRFGEGRDIKDGARRGVKGFVSGHPAPKRGSYRVLIQEPEMTKRRTMILHDSWLGGTYNQLVFAGFLPLRLTYSRDATGLGTLHPILFPAELETDRLGEMEEKELSSDFIMNWSGRPVALALSQQHQILPGKNEKLRLTVCVPTIAQKTFQIRNRPATQSQPYATKQIKDQKCPPAQ